MEVMNENRLTDEQIAAHLVWARQGLVVEMHESEAEALLVEIQQRRAADLTPENLETVREMLVEFEANDMGWENGCEDVVAVCRKILRAHGASP
jgi:alkylhydroperoxidase family enzyme